jgi:hypothetical protein
MMAEATQLVAGLTVAAWAVQQANHHRVGATVLDRIAVALIGAGAVMAVLGVAFSRAPVVIDSRAQVVSHAPGELMLHMYGYKPANRGMCKYLGTDAYVISGGELLEVPAEYQDDPTMGNTRPPGLHDFGVLRITYPQALPITAAQVRAHHKCAWWMPVTHTDMGPFPVPKAVGIPQRDITQNQTAAEAVKSYR